MAETNTTPERSAWLPSIRAYPWERELLERVCDLEKVKMSEYIRRVLVDSARRRVGRHENG